MITLTKSGLSMDRLELPRLTNHNPCNPSIVSHGGRLLATYRGCNYGRPFAEVYKFWNGSTCSQASVPDSQNYIAYIDKDFTKANCKFIEDRHLRSHRLALDGIQDLRLFEWRNELFVLGSAKNANFPLQDGTRANRNTMMLCRLNNGYLQLVCFLPTQSVSEKNWMPWARDDRLFFVYHSDPYTILEFNENACTKVQVPAPVQSLAGLSGGSCVMPFEDKFIAVLHSRSGSGIKRVYSHIVALYSKDFEVISLSPPFSFEGESIEFCAGMAISGGDVIFSYGVWDQQAVLAKFRLYDCLDILGLPHSG